jgi:hypothetical protein
MSLLDTAPRHHQRVDNGDPRLVDDDRIQIDFADRIGKGNRQRRKAGYQLDQRGTIYRGLPP